MCLDVGGRGCFQAGQFTWARSPSASSRSAASAAACPLAAAPHSARRSCHVASAAAARAWVGVWVGGRG